MSSRPRETALPQAVAEYDHRRGAGRQVLILSKWAALCRRDTQHLEVVVGDGLASHEQRPVACLENAAHERMSLNALERVDALLDRQKVRIRRGQLGKLLADLRVDLDKLLGMGHGRVTQQDGVDDAEERGGQADAKRERTHGSQREAGSPDELSDAVSQVPDECPHSLIPGEIDGPEQGGVPSIWLGFSRSGPGTLARV